LRPNYCNFLAKGGLHGLRRSAQQAGFARHSLVVRAADDQDIGAAGTAAIAVGLVANPVVLWSEFTLKTTGAGLQGDALGALEGLSYLAILGIVGWSVYTKATSGSGLPAGPSGLLGAVEGFSYLSLLAGVVVFALQAAS